MFDQRKKFKFITKCDGIITNCDTLVYYIVRWIYYKLRQVLQSVMIITNCDSTDLLSADVGNSF